MANITTEVQFPAALVEGMFSAVQGHSTLARLSGGKPIPFAGATEMVFSMNGEADIVGEAAQKSPGDAAVTPVTVKPIKFVYQHRITDEFIRMSDEARLPYLQAFAEGFSKKIARGLDIAAFHGINPKSGAASTVVGNNHMDHDVSTTVTYTSGNSVADEVLDAAIQAVLAADGEVTGIALSPIVGGYMANLRASGGVRLYPEFAFGGRPETFAGKGIDINGTVNKKITSATSRDLAIVGDFENAFRWGYAGDIPLEVIEYGDPDGQGDLKRQNQVVLRSEAYIGWAVLNGGSFARIVDTVTAGQTE